jgi:hypothetical protein
MATHSTALQHCFNEVATSAPMALERCLNQVVTSLQDAELKSNQSGDRTELGEAWRELQRQQPVWCKRYPDELRAAFTADQAKDAAARAPVPRHTANLELALMDDSAIDGVIESSRLVSHVMPIVERPVSELDALVSSAMGLATVRPELNPLRPEIFAQSLRALIDGAQVKPATGSLWMKHLAEPLGQELQSLYQRLVVQLKDANVQAAEYRFTQAAGGPVRTQSAPAADAAADGGGGGSNSGGGSGGTGAQANRGNTPSAGGQPGSASQELPSSFASLSSRQISHALLRDFVAHGAGEHATQVLPPSYYAEVDRELERLQAEAQGERDVAPEPPVPESYRDMPAVDRPQRAIGVQSRLNSEAWGDYAHSHERSLVRTRLRKDATQVAQVLGLELVRKVVNQIAQDPRLLGPVREAIVALEPSLLRLAMVDPRFFTEEEHPGRLLMERVALRSFKYNDEFSKEFASFFDGVRGSFNELNKAEIPDAQPFELVLQGLEAVWAEQDRIESDPLEQAVAAMRFAERRQAEADQIAWGLSTRPDLETVPSVVQDFLFGPWALVLAHARLTDGANRIDPQGYLSVITDLLWSVKPEVTMRQPAQLFERIPPLLAKLREGLALVGQEADESFFQELMELHRPVLKLRRAKSRQDALESGHAPLSAMDADRVRLEDPDPEEKAAKSGQPWMSANELSALGFQETMPTDMAQLWAQEETSRPAPLEPAPAVAVAVAKAPPPPAVVLDPDTVLANLREGDWIDLYSKRRWLRAQLIWASTKGTLFMFVSHGGQPHSMTKRICERLIRDRFLRPVRMHGVVAGALDAVGREEPADATA